jgi:DNA topoisomerase-3
MKALLIAEKPSLMRDIQSVYNSMSHPDQIDFTALAGHVVELKSPEDYSADWGKPWRVEVLPMVPQTFAYEPKKSTFDLFKKARDLIKNRNYDYLINACDAGREGELIFYAFYKTIGCKLPVKRLWASDTTEATMKKALDTLLDDKEPSLTRLKASSQYRAYFDWLMGMNLSRAITLKTNKLIPVGRVMTPTLAIIVNRELEIQKFVPQDYWLIEGSFGDYSGIWFDEKTGETKFFDKDKAEALKKSLGKEGIVDYVEKKRNKRNAPTLHSLLELQKEANKAFGYPADKTLAIAQTLYETKKLLSYPRTESRFLPKNLAKEVPNRLKALQGIDEVKGYVSAILADQKRMDETLGSKKYVDDKKVTDHHAIIPTDTKPNMASLSKEEKNVYMLVVKRLLAIFMDAYETDKTTIITKVDNELFKTTGTTVAKLGYMELYKSASKKKTDDDAEDGNVLPVVKKGQKVPVTKMSLLKKETTPPSRYDDASILQAMANAGGFIDDDELQNILKETAGLGTSATRAGILTKLVDRQMIGRKGKSIFASQFGIDIIQALNGKDIVSPELTAKWEIKLSQIEDGSYAPKDFYNEMISYTQSETTNYLNTINRTITQVDESKLVGDCPKCKANVTEGKSFYVCKNYKDTCDFILPKEFGGAKLTKTEVKKLLAGKETKEFDFKWKSGKTGKGKLVLTSEGKIGFADGNSSKGSSKSSGSSTSSAGDKKSLGACPKCAKKVVESKNYFLCEDYKNPCDFIIGKDIKGTPVTAEDVKNILGGKESQVKEFSWGKRKLKWNKAEKKLDFVNA